MRVEYECAQCGEHVTKERTPANLRGRTPRYCSRECAGIAARGTGSGKTPNVTYICAWCGELVTTYRSPSRLKSGSPHYCSLRCLGQAQTGQSNPAWTGGMHQLNTGYWVILCPNHPKADPRGYVLEHRLVMERVIGRYLNESEVVHHINHDKSDNRPENLQLFASHSEHMRHHQQEAQS